MQILTAGNFFTEIILLFTALAIANFVYLRDYSIEKRIGGFHQHKQCIFACATSHCYFIANLFAIMSWCYFINN